MLEKETTRREERTEADLELSFRLGLRRHDAQPCYCDEPNCVGSIGGKTQTDVGGMDDLYLDGEFARSLLRPLVSFHRFRRFGLIRAPHFALSSPRNRRRSGTARSQGEQEEEGEEVGRGLHGSFFVSSPSSSTTQRVILPN